ncbi:helix-turn-helix domain-containing protein [Amycolatopsis sp. NPDC006131]|uniref:helix-turn-helix transcriptional regulator n=1 Tax=Amycolatopsis sp. NPDC006131 TaxID=3156731 RepID=UPI0033A44A13
MENVSKIGRLWTVDDVSEYLSVPVATLYQWRSKGYGPAGRRVGKYLRYRPEDVKSWVDGLADEVA